VGAGGLNFVCYLGRGCSRIGTEKTVRGWKVTTAGVELHN